MHPVVLMQFAAPRRAAALPQDGARALDQHQGADDAEKEDVGQADYQVDLADGAQPGEQLDAEIGAEETAREQDAAHLEIDVAAPPVRDHARHRRRNDLVGFGRHRDRRRDADEDQQRRHQEAAADAEQAGKKTDSAAQPHQQEHVDGDLGDRKIDLHNVRDWRYDRLAGTLFLPPVAVKPRTGGRPVTKPRAAYELLPAAEFGASISPWLLARNAPA